ncbi:MAG: Ig-like domain-containing protein [Lachnospiraceae bacterium]|nr:Ig-like domain-containing protein [Lachnospiraceae bacterium]
MGRKKKKLYQAKRLLAMILAVTMVFGMTPTAVQAAPGENAEQTGAEAAVPDGKGDDSTEPSPEASGQPEEDNIGPAEEADPPDNTTDNGDSPSDSENTGEQEGSPDQETEDSGNNGGEAAAEENREADADNAVDNSPMADAAEAQTKPEYEIITDGFETEMEYTGSSVFDLSSIELAKTENGETTRESALDAGVTAVWKVQGADAAMTGEPVNVGKYELTLTYPKVEGKHDGTEKKVECEITKASVRFIFESERVNVKPGTAAKDVKLPAISYVRCAGNNLDAEDFDLKVAAVKDAVTGTEIKGDDKLLRGGDYALEIKPDIKADAAQAKKDISANYDLAAFTADIEIGELIETYIEVKLAEKWQENNAITLKTYDGKAAEGPGSDDYTAEVQYLDEATGEYKKLEGAEITGRWITGWDEQENPINVAPVDAGEYTYELVFEGIEGEYQETSAYIDVEIAPAALKIQVKDADKKLVLPQGTTMQEVLSKADYVVTDEAGKDITGEIKKKQIWGTSFDDSNMSQIYEPLLSLEVKEGTVFTGITDADYELEGGREYRVVFDGKKAVYNADGTFGHRTDINESENINGYDGNYTTDTTKTADDKARAVEVTAATKAVIDVSELVKDENAALIGQIATLNSKVYDGREIYSARSQYKNKVGLKTADAQGTKLKTLAKEFSYEWQRNNAAENLQDKENLENEDNWSRVYDWEFIISPADAGIYRLKITYQDMTDDGTLYYAENPEYVYYAIDKKKVRIIPDKDKSYETLSGRYVADFFYENEITCSILDADAEGEKAVAFPEGQHTRVIWQVQEIIEGAAEPNIYTEDDWHSFVSDGKTSYAIQAAELAVYTGSYYDMREDYSRNYTIVSAETAPLIVKPMGTTQLKVEVDASKWSAKTKVYNGEPFSEKELVADGLVTVKKVENGTETVIEDPGIAYMGYNEEYNEFEDLAWITDAGEYTLYVWFGGSETYAPITNPDPDDWFSQGVKLGTFKITKREITLKVTNLPETYEAGYIVGDVLEDIPGHIYVEGYAPDDEWAFTEQKYEDGYYIPAWSEYGEPDEPAFAVYEKGRKSPVDSWLLKWDKDFEVRYDVESSSLAEYYPIDEYSEYGISFSRNYKVAAGQSAEFSTVRGNSGITSVWYNGIDRVAVRSAAAAGDTMTQEVTILEGIGYYTEKYLGETGVTEGNLVAFEITPPAYYGATVPATAMYKNEIEKQKGIVVGYDPIRVVFDAREGRKTFKIRWEDDYVETYVLKLDEAVKLGNLEEAVAPKSLAFNAADKKMAVGESQQLDVKITKAQMGDIIKLGYKSSDETVLRVNENGYVTALKEGKASIEVFPLHQVEGKLERIKDAKGKDAKGATVAITVTKVSAPKPVKVTSHGTYVDVNYDIPKDGYRREIYVVDNEKNPGLKNANAIEAKVVSTKEDQWKNAFAIKPVYQDSADESYNKTRNKYTVRLAGLNTKGSYTVYVRNVCAARELADGSVITKETVDASAAGTAVSFKTLKSEVESLELYLNAPENAWDYDEEGYHRLMWFSGLKDGTVNCSPYGYFWESELEPTADASDQLRIALPFAGEDKKKYKDFYEEPKLEYALKLADEDQFTTKNKAASIDKKGKIKFTGIPTDDNPLIIRMCDTVSGEVVYGELSFRDGADSVMAAKGSVKLSVGQRQKLTDLVTYKLGKTKLTYYPAGQLDLDAVRSAIKSQRQESFFKVSESGYLTAIKSGGSLTLGLTDKNVAKVDKDNATATVKFTTGDLEAVKKLKAFDVIDNSFGLTFTHAGGAETFLVEISDGSKMIYSRRYSAGSHEVWTDDGKRVKDTYTIWPGEIGARLNRESSYTVTVKAQYDVIESKAASTKVKTTKIPAVESYIGDDEYADADKKIKRRGGMSLHVGEYEWGQELGEENTSLKVLSGNSYTLTASVDSNRGRVNDTLVWTVDDAKVASVKAAAGTYCITLKGLKPGRTVLEVKSKIWGNKVIARYDIVVVAVGNAYNYYGDNEPWDYESPSINNGGNNAPDYLPLSVNDRRKVTIKQTEYFSFTAPETGKYRFSGIGYVGGTIRLGKSEGGWPDPNYSSALDLGLLRAGETVYLSSLAEPGDMKRAGNVSYYVEVIMTQSEAELVENISAAGETTVTNYEGEKIFQFTAPEAGDYSFSFTNNYNNTQYLYLYTSRDAALNGSYDYEVSGYSISYTLAQGESVWLRAANLYSYYSYTFRVEKTGVSDPELSVGTPKDVSVAAGKSQELTFSVADAGYYTFSSAEGTGYSLASRAAGDSNVLVTLTVNGNVKYSENGSQFEIQVYLNANDQVSLTIANRGGSVSALTVTVQKTEVPVTEVETGTPVSAEDGGLYKFTAGEAGIYEFFLSSPWDVYLYGSEADACNGDNALNAADENKTIAEYGMSAGETVWMSTQLSSVNTCELTITRADQEMALGSPYTVSVPGTERHRYLIYKVTQDGNYRFAAVREEENGGTANANIVEITVNDIMEEQSNTTYFDFRRVLQSGDEVCIKVNSDMTGNTTDVTVKAEELTITDVVIGGTNEITLDEGQKNAAFKFTAADAGEYQFKVTATGQNMKLYLYEEAGLNDLFTSNTEAAKASCETSSAETVDQGQVYFCTITDVELTAGQVVYINPWNTTDDSSLAVTVIVEKVTETGGEIEGPTEPTEPTDPEGTEENPAA